MNLPPAIFLMGPTASGKTDAAIYLAEQRACEIISVDATLVYRGMDIGSAKPDLVVRERVPHHLIDIRDPATPYSVAEFRQDALRLMSDITARGRIPLLVGGTMLYFKILRDGMAELPQTSPQVRADILEEAALKGWPAMHTKLAAIDPQTASTLHPNHSQRIGRALEVHAMTGHTLSALRASQAVQPLPYRLLQLALMPEDRDGLNRRICQRFDRMMEGGFLSEVESLYQRGDLSLELPALRAVGYRQAWEYLCGRYPSSGKGFVGVNLTREQMIERAKIASCQLAKRQLTWLRSWPDLQSVTIEVGDDAGAVVGERCLRAVDTFLYPGV